MTASPPREGGASDPSFSAATESLDGEASVFSTGAVIGGRYRIVDRLGRGGMGEVWRAYDIKLQVEVALKSLHAGLAGDEKRLQLLRQEVRAARQVVSPNVCRIFDLIDAEGAELLSMEYVDGTTLLHILRERGPLDLEEAQGIACQFLAGLEAIHSTGLVHRDLKPENIMVTRTGRVVLMDFGLARTESDGSSTVSGTPAYMAPEQMCGDAVDARADVYAAGVVLAEMVAPGGISSPESRQSVWEGVRLQPARVPDIPWAPVVRRAVTRDREHRYGSAHTLARALEEIALRVEGADDLNPYPGLSSFTVEHAEYFFGREAEVEALWSRLESPQLTAIIGPSGAGKSSFVNAGLMAARPPGWGIVICIPGASPLANLRDAMAPEVAGDAEAIKELVRVDEPSAMVSVVSRWRQRHDHGLILVDQFEELFTLNEHRHQAAFAELLGSLVLDANVHVLLSMRDDFFFHCQGFEALRPAFSRITPVAPLDGAGLRRALVQPAMKCGYRFEDEDLVDEMLREVKGERGALPLTAFAVSRLWEERDREHGHLTRAAYEKIGGVGGALARHAERTMGRIGAERHGIVRELFRNLLTSDGTRAARDHDELLSVFDPSERADADRVLGELIDARLLTSFDWEDEAGDAHRRVDIIHESLLANWPRLVRWQMQDAEGARLRDELRQAAHNWDEHGRSDDRLWTGTALRELGLWRERYTGQLSDREQAFATAATALSSRRRRRRRLAVASVLIALLLVAVVVTSLWRRAEHHALRAEASTLHALGQMEVERSAALAYAIASLELADSSEVRLFALEQLSGGPTRLILDRSSGDPEGIDFSPDGRRLAVGFEDGTLRIYHFDGSEPLVIRAHPRNVLAVRFVPGRDLVATGGQEDPALRLWSATTGAALREVVLDPEALGILVFPSSNGERLVVGSYRDLIAGPITWHELAPDSSDSVHLANGGGIHSYIPSPDAGLTASINGAELEIRPLAYDQDSPPLLSFRHDAEVLFARFDQNGSHIATMDANREISLFSVAAPSASPIRLPALPQGAYLCSPRFDDGGEWLATGVYVMEPRLWNLRGSPDAEPLVLDEPIRSDDIAFHPGASWVATAESGGVYLWRLDRTYPQVFSIHDRITGLQFSPDRRFLWSCGYDGNLRRTPLTHTDAAAERVVFSHPESGTPLSALSVGDQGRLVAFGDGSGLVRMVDTETGMITVFEGFAETIWLTAIDSRRRLLAASGWGTSPAATVIRVWDLETGECAILDDGDGLRTNDLVFLPDGRLLAPSGPSDELRIWDLDRHEVEVIGEEVQSVGLSRDARLMISCPEGSGEDNWRSPATLHDLEARTTRALSHMGEYVSAVAMDPDSEFVVTADGFGIIRVAPTDGDAPHLLLGHEGTIWIVKVSPDGQLIASSGFDDGTIRVWEVPDLDRPPEQTLPSGEFLARLKASTSLRVATSGTGGYEIQTREITGWDDTR